MVPAYGPKSAYVMELDLLCRSEVKVSVSCIKILRRWAIGRYCRGPHDNAGVTPLFSAFASLGA